MPGILVDGKGWWGGGDSGAMVRSECAATASCLVIQVFLPVMDRRFEEAGSGGYSGGNTKEGRQSAYVCVVGHPMCNLGDRAALLVVASGCLFQIWILGADRQICPGEGKVTIQCRKKTAAHSENGYIGRKKLQSGSGWVGTIGWDQSGAIWRELS